MNQDTDNHPRPHDAFEDEPSDDFESLGDYHRAAAEHFAAAARHHLLAAVASDEGDTETGDRHSYLAYRHRLNGTQYAEIAVMDSDSGEDAGEDSF